MGERNYRTASLPRLWKAFILRVMLTSPSFVSRPGFHRFFDRTKTTIAASLYVLVAACASAPPPAPPVVAEPTPQPIAATCTCEPAEPVVAPPTPPPPPTPTAEEPRGTLQVSPWEDLPAWGTDPLAPALQTFLQSCTVLQSQPPWQSVCDAARNLPAKLSNDELKRFFQAYFVPYQIINADGSGTGMVTGYYEPLLYGSRIRTARYRYPLYAPPDDLLTIDLSSLYPEFKNKRLRGRLVGNTVLPYLSRAEIDVTDPPLKGKELVWVNDPVEAFFLHIQGSGQVRFENGEIMRVGYADQNGHPFRSVGRYLIQQGEMRAETVSMQGIKKWARKHPAKLDSFLNINPSYVFFKELPGDLPGPIGALGVPLTAERSIAVDSQVVPLGVPVYLATTWPNSSDALNRLMVAQDTGGAIAGAVRADFYWGFGDDAGKLAGSMRQSGRMWVLLPKDYVPEPH
jgi:membrane-bound lytic murein transglycosylase A